MQFVGDAVMGVFGAPLPLEGHAARAVRAATEMHARQAALNGRWAAEGLPPFALGIGLSTGTVAGALLGSEERVEYSLVGDSVNLAQRLQQLAAGGETVVSEATKEALPADVPVEPLEPTQVKGRESVVAAFRLAAARPVSERRRRDGLGARARRRRPAAVPQRGRAGRAGHRGFEVVGEADSGETAVELAAQLAPDLVLMDINLPGIDGLEATRRILVSSTSEVVVVALSTETGLATRAVASGAAAFIAKADFDPDRLSEAWASARG